jgi:hypothetical protein
MSALGVAVCPVVGCVHIGKRERKREWIGEELAVPLPRVGESLLEMLEIVTTGIMA